MQRIVGLRAGRVVFDGAPSALTPAVLTEIYGEEDWTASLADKRAQSTDDAELDIDEERMAGLT